MSRTETCVITGGAGFVGQHLLAELQREQPSWRLVVWDRNVDRLPSSVEAHEVDVTQPATYQEHLQSLQPTWVVHLAALASVPHSLKDPSLVTTVNVTASVQLLETLIAVSPATKFFAVSSADIYGAAIPEMSDSAQGRGVVELPLDRARPVNPYAQSKLALERAIEERFLDRVVRARPFPHIGPGQALGFVTADFASQIVAIEAGRQDPVLRVGNLEARRDFTDVRDVVRAYRLLLEHGMLGEVYHVASGNAVSIRSLVDVLLSLSVAAIEVVVDQERLRPLDVPVLVGDATKLRALTGWKPLIPLEQSLRDILAWWREQERQGSGMAYSA